MPSKRLTKMVVDRTAPPKTGRLEIRDTTLPGFGVRITDRGARSYFVVYRIAGDETRKQRRATIGPCDAWELADAREKARGYLASAKRGVDPVEAEAEQRALSKQTTANTFAKVRDQYIKVYQKPKNRSWKQVEDALKLYCTDWNDKPITSIKKADVAAVIEGIALNHPTAANRTLAHVKHMLSWAAKRDIIETSPAADVDKPAPDRARSRVLTNDEIKAIWLAADEVGWPYGPIARLLFLTAQRVREVGRLRWKDLDNDTRAWTLPREFAKTSQENIVPLSPMARDIILALPKHGDSEWVFPSSKGTPPSGWSKAKIAFDQASGVSDWQFRDIRRTVATGMARHRVDRFIIEQVLNHSVGGSAMSAVENVYNTHRYLAEKRAALEKWADTLGGIVGAPKSNVVTLGNRK